MKKFIMTLFAVAACSFMNAQGYTWEKEPCQDELIGLETTLQGQSIVYLVHYHPSLKEPLQQLSDIWDSVDPEDVQTLIECRIPFSYIVPRIHAK